MQRRPDRFVSEEPGLPAAESGPGSCVSGRVTPGSLTCIRPREVGLQVLAGHRPPRACSKGHSSVMGAQRGFRAVVGLETQCLSSIPSFLPRSVWLVRPFLFLDLALWLQMPQWTQETEQSTVSRGDRKLTKKNAWPARTDA